MLLFRNVPRGAMPAEKAGQRGSKPGNGVVIPATMQSGVSSRSSVAAESAPDCHVEVPRAAQSAALVRVHTPAASQHRPHPQQVSTYAAGKLPPVISLVVSAAQGDPVRGLRSPMGLAEPSDPR